METAAPIAESCGVDPQVDERLRERRNWGDECPAQTAQQFLEDWRRSTVEREWSPASGDSSLDAGTRFVNALDDLARSGAERIVVVSHGGVTIDGLRNLVGDHRHLR